jgi:hypothetical protein
MSDVSATIFLQRRYSRGCTQAQPIADASRSFAQSKIINPAVITAFGARWKSPPT